MSNLVLPPMRDLCFVDVLTVPISSQTVSLRGAGAINGLRLRAGAAAGALMGVFLTIFGRMF